MSNHLKIYSENNNLNLKIGLDTYYCINNNVDINIINTIINDINNKNYFVKSFHFWLMSSKILIKYNLTNFNNNINFDVYYDSNFVGTINFKCREVKTESSTQLDILSNIFNQLSL